MSDNLREIYGPGESSVALAARAERVRAELAATQTDDDARAVEAARAQVAGIDAALPGRVATELTTQVPAAVAEQVATQVDPKVSQAEAARVAAVAATSSKADKASPTLTGAIKLQPAIATEEGIVEIGRSDGANRAHRLRSLLSASSSANSLTVSVHNGTQGATVDVLKLTGDGKATALVDMVVPAAPLTANSAVPRSYADAINASVAGKVTITAPEFKPATNASTEGMVYFGRADNVDRRHRFRYLSGGGGLTDYFALDVANGTLGGFVEAFRASRSGTVGFVGGNLRTSRATVAAEHVPAIVTHIQTMGYTTAGDGGGATYVRVGTNPSHQGKVASLDGSWWELQRQGGEVNILQFGAIADNATDIRPAFNNAIAYTNTKYGGGVIRIPAGQYAKVTGSQISITGNITIVGDGRYRSVINEVLGSSIQGYVFAATDAANVELRDFGIVGALDADVTAESTTIRIDGCNNFRAQNLWITKARGYAIFTSGCKYVQILHNRIHKCKGDNIALYGNQDVLVDGNFISCSIDDSISWQGLAANTVAHDRVVITNNIIVEAPGPHGYARNCVVANNILVRPYAHGLWVSYGNAVYDAPSVNMIVTGNVVADCIHKPAGGGINVAGYLFVGGGLRHGAAMTLAGAPGTPDGVGGIVGLLGTGTGNFYKPGISDLSPVVPSPGGLGIIVSHNTVTRTLPDVSQVGTWAYEATGIMSQDGDGHFWPYNGTSVGLLDTCDGIIVRMGMVKAQIVHNVVSIGSNYGIVIQNFLGGDPATLGTLQFADLLIESNQVSRCKVACIGVDPAYGLGGTAQDVRLRGNILDADPDLASTGRVAGGKWASSAAVYGIDVGTCSGFRMDDNEIRNCAVPIRAGANCVIRRTRLLCDPAAVGGWNADNVGIGNCPAPGAHYEYVITDGNPMSATYGQQIAPALGQSAAMPTSGKYVQGTWVDAELPTISSGKILRGWLRLTTGTAHVAGVDWTPVFGGTS